MSQPSLHSLNKVYIKQQMQEFITFLMDFILMGWSWAEGNFWGFIQCRTNNFWQAEGDAVHHFSCSILMCEAGMMGCLKQWGLKKRWTAQTNNNNNKSFTAFGCIYESIITHHVKIVGQLTKGKTHSGDTFLFWFLFADLELNKS